MADQTSINKGGIILVSCALCGASDAETVMAGDDYYNRDGLPIVRCKRCGLAYTNPRLAAQESLYTDSLSPHVEPSERAKRRERSTADYRVEKLSRTFGRTGRMLEIGCGDCVFLEEAASQGWKVVGIDLSSGSEKMLRPVLKLDIRTATVESLDPDRQMFDVIAAWDVIEHVTDPVAFLESASRLLIDGGLIVLRAPNFAAYRVFLPGWKKSLDRILQRKRRQYDTESHIFHFDTKSLKRLVESCGFGVVDIAPDWDYAFSRPKSLLSRFDRSRRMSTARRFFAVSGENVLPELVVYARKGQCVDVLD